MAYAQGRGGCHADGGPFSLPPCQRYDGASPMRLERVVPDDSQPNRVDPISYGTSGAGSWMLAGPRMSAAMIAR